MFAIVDIETTGGSAGRDKITEICILVHDGLAVVEKYSTLINPERRIPEYIARMTGISNEMVENAPKFYDVARKIVELTEGNIFVAHNVGFDYGFIQEEFRSLGYKWEREKLCTVRLSRKLLPRRISYSLGRLCESLGIPNEARHRAEGDAVATAKLFDLLLLKKAEHPTYRRHDIGEINATKIDKIKLHVLKKLPEETGVYYFLDRAGKIIYIGKSNNMRQRAIAHFSNSNRRAAFKMLDELIDVDFVKTGNELIALLHESEEIKTHKPKYNRMRKRDVFTHAIDWFADENGIINIQIVPYEKAQQPLISFTTYLSARDRLNEWMDEHALCMSYTGLNPQGGECLQRHVKKCYGICTGDEDADTYNLRAKKIVAQYQSEMKNYVLVGEGRHEEEQSLVLFENGRYAGYGYVDKGDPVNSPEDLKTFIKRAPYYPDADQLARGYLKKNTMKMVKI
ncbi:MAG TPA: exonuclease domain-containing protein [Bacteroidia bacterium]|nr:exonuclease domain-containing protein [Bacteroidia bacterium]